MSNIAWIDVENGSTLASTVKNVLNGRIAEADLTL